ncbi:MAG: M23 family metallopeptidase [Acidobacteriota bacterium]
MWTRPLLPFRWPLRGAVVLALIAIAASIALVTQQLDLTTLPVPPVVEAKAWQPDVPVRASLEDDVPLARNPPQPFTVERGQTPTGLMLDLGVEPSAVHGAVTVLAEHVDLRRLRAGETGIAYYDDDGRFERLRLRLARRGWLTLESSSGGFEASFRELHRSVEIRRAEGVLESSLLGSLAAAEAPQALAYAMADVLQWDLDFNRDLRLGDHYRVVYEQETIEGQASRVRRVLALAYQNRDVVHEAYLWRDEEGGEGYYDSEGRPLRKMFLRSPLPFTRVTSRFSHRRFHPVLKTYRPHYGVDFGAPRGTPVRVTASGTVTFAGRSGGAGKMVKVRHANGFETLYLHLSGYAKGLNRGDRVRQGDLVGYVGSTGLSTGPHLDYRVKRNGKYLDPMRLENRPAEPIPQHRLADFQAHLRAVRSVLERDVVRSGELAGLAAVFADERAGEQLAVYGGGSSNTKSDAARRRSR